MPRNFPDWLPAYIKYASVGEAPIKMHTWSGISALAAVLRRRVWLDMKRFVWYPGLYIIFVAKPGIVQKSTTIDISMDLVKQIDSIHFGPNSVTWQALVEKFAGAAEQFEWPLGSGEWMPMSALTLVASELGSLLNLQDRDMVTLFIELFDGKKSYDKLTKMDSNIIDAPWINMIAATTPHWIAENMPQSTVGGGLTSRCIFVWAEEKERYVPYVDEMVEHGDEEYRLKLIQDLEHISITLCGPFTISPAARDWGRAWYTQFWKDAKDSMDSQMVEGYAARKQTHMHKVAMILSAAKSDSQIIEADDLILANVLLEQLEPDMQKVFDRIGRTEESLQAERFIDIVRKAGKVPYSSAYALIHSYFPDFRDFEGILAGAINSGQLEIRHEQGGMFLVAVNSISVIPL